MPDPSGTDNFRVEDVDRIISDYKGGAQDVIPILRRIQDQYHFLPEAALRRVCDKTSITSAALAGVSTFYSGFRHRPAGKHTIRVCVGTACHVKGADRVTDAIKLNRKIDASDDTDDQRLFTVEEVACLGCCMLAPVARIDEVTYGDVKPQRVSGVLRDFLSSREPTVTRSSGAGMAARTAEEIRICLCSSCIAAGSRKIYDETKRQVHLLKLAVSVRQVGCTGISYQAPLVDVVSHGDAFRYGRVEPPDMRGILLEHFQPEGLGRKIAVHMSNLIEGALTDKAVDPQVRYIHPPRDGIVEDAATGQVQLATEHGGKLSPLSLDDYIAHDGFKALKACMTTMSPEEVVDAIQASGLRGRGGAGFPSGIKWGLMREQEELIRYVVCNGDEGDPGAFMDRMILESFPYRVLEGLSIAAYAVGAQEGFLYIRGEYPLASEHIRHAISECEKRNLLGDDLFGSGKSLKLQVAEGAGAFVCGEETALLASIEGGRGMPRFRPPYPAQKGLWGKPTLINNVETLALVPWIIRNGPEKFAAIGSEKSKGTKTFALAGQVLNGGLIEVPIGLTLRQIVENIGGGVPDGKALKAVQVGGPSGGCVPHWLADTQVDYESLHAVGAIMGSGGMVVLDETDCMVDVARYFLTFTQAESCGKCTHCRVGTKRMLEILTRLCEGTGEPQDLDRLEELVKLVPQGSLCGLGKSAPNPVASTLTHFRDEYEAHLEGRCPAKKCQALISYRITDSCIGCTLCAQQCPSDAIALTPYKQHHIDMDKCIRCDICREVCCDDAVLVETR